MKNVIEIDKDILVSSVIVALGGGTINWEYREVELEEKFLGKTKYDTQELLIKFIAEGRNNLYKGGKSYV